MTKKFNQFLGKAGHLHMMAEFLMKGHYVFIVRLGDDTWSKPVIIKQDILNQMYEDGEIG